MDKTDVPTAFGVFKPVGHIVIAFRSENDLNGAREALLLQGFDAPALVHYSPGQMKTQVDQELEHASALASIGQEMNLVKAHRSLAEDGCSFLIVPAADDTQAEQVATVARSMHAVTAQRYSRFIIEELIEAPEAGPQVFESPDRGLDSRGGTSRD